jgi:hypothetical protein
MNLKWSCCACVILHACMCIFSLVRGETMRKLRKKGPNQLYAREKISFICLEKISYIGVIQSNSLPEHRSWYLWSWDWRGPPYTLWRRTLGRHCLTTNKVFCRPFTVWIASKKVLSSSPGLRACICKPFKEPGNRFPARRAGTTALFVVPVRQAILAGGWNRILGSLNVYKFGRR